VRPDVGVGRLAQPWRLSFGGLVVACLFLCLSLTPSLLPRSWLFQGIVSGILVAIGYGIGVLASWSARKIFRRQPSPAIRRNSWLTLAAVGIPLTVLFLYLNGEWQGDIRALGGAEQPSPYRYVGVVLVTAAVFAILLGGSRLLRRVARRISRFLGRWVSARIATAIGAVLVAVLTFGIINGLMIDGLLNGANDVFREVNGQTKPGVDPPASGLVTGGPGSLMSWASLGNQGRTFVTGAPTVAEIRRFGGAHARQPIRVYAGLDSAPTAQERATLAVRELERTGAFSREVLCVITTTGTGWVDEHAADSLELMYSGNTAEVGMQYSYLPSWMSFIVDGERAKDAGRELFNQVYERWSRLPAGQRPKLLVFGESLGAYGGEAAFAGLADMRSRTNGILWVGPPNSSTLVREFTEAREVGTAEVFPIFEDGRSVRFGDDTASLATPSVPWTSPRTVYLQHPSDPIVWWSPDLMFNKPDWLRERRGSDVLPAMTWYPLVTFWQTTADMAVANNVPAGHGHMYGSEVVDAWAAIAPPVGWTPQKTARLKQIVGE